MLGRTCFGTAYYFPLEDPYNTARVVRFLGPKQCLPVNVLGGVGQGDWCTSLSSTAQFFTQQKGRRSHQTNGEAQKRMKNDFAMNDTYSRCVTLRQIFFYVVLAVLPSKR